MSARAAVLTMMLTAALLAACRAPSEGPAPSVPPSSGASQASAPGPAPDANRLVGQWMRTDSEYVIGIEGVAPDGKVSARYLNPQPINVSRAEVKNDDGRLRLLVELRDKGYPGSYYTLTYDPQGDSLYGVYHHLGLNENFDVSFYRLARDKGPAK
jgi:hypothetical protein